MTPPVVCRRNTGNRQACWGVPITLEETFFHGQTTQQLVHPRTSGQSNLSRKGHYCASNTFVLFIPNVIIYIEIQLAMIGGKMAILEFIDPDSCSTECTGHRFPVEGNLHVTYVLSGVIKVRKTYRYTRGKWTEYNPISRMTVAYPLRAS